MKKRIVCQKNWPFNFVDAFLIWFLNKHVTWCIEACINKKQNKNVVLLKSNLCQTESIMAIITARKINNSTIMNQRVTTNKVMTSFYWRDWYFSVFFSHLQVPHKAKHNLFFHHKTVPALHILLKIYTADTDCLLWHKISEETTIITTISSPELLLYLSQPNCLQQSQLLLLKLAKQFLILWQVENKIKQSLATTNFLNWKTQFWKSIVVAKVSQMAIILLS